MRKAGVSLSERTLMYIIGGQLFSQAPNRHPRKVGVIMEKVQESFRKDASNLGEFYTLNVPKDKLKSYIENLLKSIPEFMELNLSQIEFEKGIKVDSEDRPKYVFSSAYDIETAESWKSDFIDLDAFIQNAIRGIYDQELLQEDCFLCTNDKTEKCNTCKVNPNFKVNFECERKPTGNYTLACKYDCFRQYYVCCEECNIKYDCKHKCESCSSSCGLAINKVNTENKKA